MKSVVIKKGGRFVAVKKRKLNYRFHNPNPAAKTADYILKVFIDVNTDKVEKAIHEAASNPTEAKNKQNCCNEYPA